MCDIDSHQKKPYETIFVGRKLVKGHCQDDGGTHTDKRIPYDQVLISVPSSIHSTKPGLQGMPHSGTVLPL